MLKRKMTLTEAMVTALELNLTTRYTKMIDGVPTVLFNVPEKNLKEVKRKILDAKIRVKTLTVFTNPENQWVRVSVEELFKLGIADKISEESHISKDVVMLSEPDAEVYKEAVSKRFDGNVVFLLFINEGNKLSRVRGYPTYKAPSVEVTVGSGSKTEESEVEETA